MSRLLNSKSLSRAALIPACIWVVAAMGCGVIQHFDDDHAIGAMMAIRTAEKDFKSANGRYGTLDELATAHLAVPSPAQYGYQFTVRAAPDSYVALAVPTLRKQ